MHPDNPLIVQSDRTIMLHTVRTVFDDSGTPKRDDQGMPITEEHPRFPEARDFLATFAELEKSPDYLHTYRITAVSVWNAAAVRMSADAIEETLADLSCVPVPPNVIQEIRSWMERYGLLRIEQHEDQFILTSEDPAALEDILGHASIRKLASVDETGRISIDALQRGTIKLQFAPLTEFATKTTRVSK